MKLISLAGFIGALYWTWGLVHPIPLVHPDIQNSIQNQIQKLITRTVKQRHKEAQDIRFLEMESESLSEREVLVTFDYEFRRPKKNGQIEGSTKSQIQGNVIIKLAKAQHGQFPQWQLQEVQTTSSKVEFEKGSEITVEK